MPIALVVYVCVDLNTCLYMTIYYAKRKMSIRSPFQINLGGGAHEFVRIDSSGDQFSSLSEFSDVGFNQILNLFWVYLARSIVANLCVCV